MFSSDPSGVWDAIASLSNELAALRDDMDRRKHFEFPTNGTYTPTLTNVANITASTAYLCHWMRVSNECLVAGKADVDPTLAAASTQLGISLPFASNLGVIQDCAGTAFAPGIAGQGAAIVGDVANDRAQMQWIAGDITNQAMFFIFSFRII